MNTSEINELLLDRLVNVHERDQIEIYHFRSLSGHSNRFLSYKDIKTLKEKTPNLTSLLEGGFTVVLTINKESPTEAICSISQCNSLEGDNFDKAKGIQICLKRLDNYLLKKEKDSWNYNENHFFHLKNLPKERGKLIDSVSKYLNQNPRHFSYRDSVIVNHTEV